MADTAAAFQQDKYVVLTGLVTDPLLSQLYHYAMKRADLAPTAMERMNPDRAAPPAATAYGDPMMDTLLANLTPRLEQATGLRLYPTYSFYRVLRGGDALPRHTDRPACEISVSLNLGQQPDEPWPLWVKGPHHTTPCNMRPGDGVLYRGLDCPHWREPFTGDHCAQVSLFWVDQNGPHAEWKLDKRTMLSSFLNPPGQFTVRPEWQLELMRAQEEKAAAAQQAALTDGSEAT